MSRIRRIAITAALFCATLAAAPGLALARTPAIRVPIRPVAARIQLRQPYAVWAEARLQASLDRIAYTMSRTRMTAEKRAQINNDVMFSAGVLRARIAKVSKDRVVNSIERQEMHLLTAAIQHDLHRLHGNLDSWWLL